MDEIFGQNNFVAQMIWQKRTSPDSRKSISDGHEYITVYSKDISYMNRTFNLLPIDEEDAKKFKNPDNDPKGPWVSSDFTAQGYRPNQMYKIITPGGAEYTPTEGHCWKNIEPLYKEQLAEGRFWFGTDGKGMPRRKTYLYEKEGKNTWTWWSNKEVGHTQEATQELTAIFGTKTIFDYPKPTRLINRILQIATDKNSIILDSFAGSGTTGHAVVNLNKADGGNRKFILIEMEDYAESVTAERVRRIGGEFSFYELGETIFVGRDQEFLNEKLPLAALREYVWFSETRSPYTEHGTKNPWLGTCAETAYYFFYQKKSRTVLDYEMLAGLTEAAENYVVYADVCLLPQEFLEKHRIVFKKIPRDISRL
jgi:adenine-specific DNA-methyltransferase